MTLPPIPCSAFRQGAIVAAANTPTPVSAYGGRTPQWRRTSWEMSREIPILLSGLCLFYVLLSFAHYSTGAPASPDIQLTASALPRYAAFSLLRLGAAYLLSLVFAIGYGYVAASSPRRE